MAESQKECRVVNFAQQTTNIPAPLDDVGTSPAKEAAAICPATTSTAIIDIPDSPHQGQEQEQECGRAALTAATALLVLATVAAGVGFVATLHRAGYTINAKTVDVNTPGNRFLTFKSNGEASCRKDWEIRCVYQRYTNKVRGAQMRFLKDNKPYPTEEWITEETCNEKARASLICWITKKVPPVPKNSGEYYCEIEEKLATSDLYYKTNEDSGKHPVSANFDDCETITTTSTTSTTAPKTTSTTRTSTTTEDTPSYVQLFAFLFGVFSLVVILSVATYYWRKNNKKKNTVKSERAGTSAFTDPTSTRHSRSETSTRHARSRSYTGQPQSGSSTWLSGSRSSTRHSQSRSSTRHSHSRSSTWLSGSQSSARHARSRSSTRHPQSRSSTWLSGSQSSASNAPGLTSSNPYSRIKMNPSVTSSSRAQGSRSYLSGTSYTSSSQMSTHR